MGTIRLLVVPKMIQKRVNTQKKTQTNQLKGNVLISFSVKQVQLFAVKNQMMIRLHGQRTPLHPVPLNLVMVRVQVKNVLQLVQRIVPQMVQKCVNTQKKGKDKSDTGECVKKAKCNESETICCVKPGGKTAVWEVGGKVPEDCTFKAGAEPEPEPVSPNPRVTKSSASSDYLKRPFFLAAVVAAIFSYLQY